MSAGAYEMTGAAFSSTTADSSADSDGRWRTLWPVAAVAVEATDD